jgi:DNA polymerase II
LNQGFILTRNWRDAESGVELEFWLSTSAGPRQVVVPAQQAVFFIPTEAEAQMQVLGDRFDFQLQRLEMKNFALQPMTACYFRSQRQLRQARDVLEALDFFPLEADINPAERFLMERFVSGSMAFSEESPPRCKSSEYQPNLKLVSLDIETAMQGVELYSIGLFAIENGRRFEKVMMIGEGADLPYVETFASERALMAAFLEWVENWDPDVFIGWNVVNFDMWYLQRVADKLGMRLALGRGRRQAHWRELDDDGDRRTVQMPGRVVLDGIELLRTATYRFESFSLENVSRELLGDGKLLHGSGRGSQITDLFREDKNQLARYNLHDCELVWDIFEHTDLMNFAVARSQMTGLIMDRLGGSVAAFDHLYLPRLHREGYVAPNASTETPSSPGGFVMNSEPGIFDHVLVLDFKSLYPSIIRSFCIDPLGLALGLAESVDDPRLVEGFDGGRFERQKHVLPAIIAELWERRDAAKQRGDAAQSQAIKIIMNSFYGVLGTPGCRFFDGRLASSITRRGHQIIQETRDKIESLGDRVIYGDTDSVFVWLQDAKDDESARARGEFLQETLNQWWRERLENEYGLECILELEFETHYQRFLMPTVRGSDVGSKKRYAGVVEKEGQQELVFKGLENVRTDWTKLARRFQSELYRRVFFHEPYRDFVKSISLQLRAGEVDDELVFRKRLRRRLDDYERNIPPHVQAARLAVVRGLEKPRRGDWVEYVMTTSGAEPLQSVQAGLDYDLYAERQLAPVADGILHFLGTSFREITEAQFSLF